MEEPSTTQPFAATPRHGLNPFYNPQAQQNTPTFASQLDPGLQELDASDAFVQHFQTQLESSNHGQHLHVGNPYQGNPPPRFQEIRSHATPPRRRQNQIAKQAGQFGVLTPQVPAPIAPGPQHDYLQHNALEGVQQGSALSQIYSGNGPGGQNKKEGHFPDMKVVLNPPNLEVWRDRLFHVDETITLSEDEYERSPPNCGQCNES